MASAIADFVNNVGGSTDLTDPVVKKRAANALPMPTPLPTPVAGAGDGGSLPMPAPSTAFQVGQGARSAIGTGLNVVSAVPKAAYGAVADAANAAGSGIADFSRGIAGLPATSPAAAAPIAAPIAAKSPADVQAANTNPLFNLNIQPPGAAATPDLTRPVATPPAVAPPDDSAQYGNLPGRNGSIGFGQQIQGPNGPIQAFTDANMTAAQRANPNATDNFAKQSNGGVLPMPVAQPAVAVSPAASALLNRTPTLSADNVPRADTGNGWNDPVYQAQHAAQSDIAAIANEDPRSVLGTAARNARVSLADMKAPRSRTGVNARTPYEDAISSLHAAALQPLIDAHQQALANTQQAGETGRTQLTQAGENAREDTRTRSARDIELLRPGSPLNLEDGTTGLLGPGGLVRPAVDASGNPVRQLQKREDAGQTQDDKVAATAAKLFQDSQFSQKPLSIDEARAQAAQLHGASAATPLPEHVALLKKNSTPDMRAKFDQAYGKGAAAKVLGS